MVAWDKSVLATLAPIFDVMIVKRNNSAHYGNVSFSNVSLVQHDRVSNIFTDLKEAIAASHRARQAFSGQHLIVRINQTVAVSGPGETEFIYLDPQTGQPILASSTPPSPAQVSISVSGAVAVKHFNILPTNLKVAI